MGPEVRIRICAAVKRGVLYWQLLGGRGAVPTEQREYRRGRRGSMDLDHSWNALLRPGAATEYFDVDDPERVRIDTPGFDSTNAWWFAELSRWIYRQEFDEVGASANRPRRPGILEAANLKELRFFNRGGTRCAIVESKNHGGELFGVLAFLGTSTFGDWLSNLKPLFLSVGQGLDLHPPSRSSTGWSPASASRYGRWPPPPGCRRRRASR